MKRSRWDLGSWSFEQWLLLGLLVASLGIRLAIAWLNVELLIERTLPDDAFRYFLVADRAAQGLGFTVQDMGVLNRLHPLWALVNVPLFAWTSSENLPIHLSLTLSSLLDTCTAWLIFLTVQKLSRNWFAAIFSTLVYAFNPMVIFQSVNGLETALTTAFWAAFFFVYVSLAPRRAEASPRFSLWLGLGVLGGLMALARADSVVLVGVVALDLVWRRRRASVVPLVGLLLGLSVLLVPWYWWNRVALGTWIQIDGVELLLRRILYDQMVRAGSVTSGATLGLLASDGFQTLWQAVGIHVVGLILVLGTLWFFRSRLGPGVTRHLGKDLQDYWVPLLAALVLAGASLLSPGPSRPWTLMPLAYAMTLVVGPAAESMARSLLPLLPGWRLVPVVLLGILVLLMGGQWVRNWPVGLYPWQSDYLRAARWSNEELPPGTTVGAFNAGIQAYYSDQTVVDLDDPSDSEVYQAMRGGALHEYALDRQVDYVIDHRHDVEELYAPFWGRPLDEVLEPVQDLGTSHGLYGPLTVYELKRGSR